jgi:hypothetical protein
MTDRYGLAIAGLVEDEVIWYVYLNVDKLATDDQHTKNVIAHELAHVFCGTTEGSDMPELVAEIHADEQARRWGFESSGLLSFIERTYGHKGITPEELADAICRHLDEMNAIYKQWHSGTKLEGAA